MILHNSKITAKGFCKSYITIYMNPIIRSGLFVLFFALICCDTTINYSHTKDNNLSLQRPGFKESFLITFNPFSKDLTCYYTLL